MKNSLSRFARNALSVFMLVVPGAACALSTGLVISQVYGGGGNANAVYTHDFIELHNNSANPISLNGLAIQYASAAGTSWQVAALPNLSVQPGGYFLIQGATGGVTGMPLPPADHVLTPTINMAQASGKVALTTGISAMSGDCPDLMMTIDFVGYGSGAPTPPNCSETSPVPAMSSTLAAIRNSNGCTETDNNSTDFSVLPPNPRNATTPPSACEFTMNETNDAAEADYCIVQFPPTMTGTAGATSDLVYVRLYEAMVTEAAGASTWTVQVGYGASGVNPATQAGYTWTSAGFNVQVDNDDEYMAQFTLPADGTYGYAGRVSPDGVRWTYCDLDGAGSGPMLDFSAAQLGVLTVGGGGATVPDAPFMGSATAGNAQATVSFMPPANNGGSAITSYTVTSSPGGYFAVGAGSPITVTGLINGTAYTFTVTATNAIGTSAPSAASNSVTPSAPATVPGAPSMGSATAGNAQATVSFMPPANNGGSAITSYTVTSSPGGITASGAGSPITVTGLTNGTAYTFTVKATNAVGTGPASAASNSVTPLDPNPPRLSNISTRMQVLTGNDVMIGGFVIGGSASKTVVVRARGPSLIPFGITNALANPQLQLVRSSDQQTIATNDDWQQAANQGDIAQSGFAPGNALEAAILIQLAPGAYTAIVTGVGNGTGVGIVEVFEVDGLQIPLANISTRGQVLTGNDVMIGGFVVTGSGPQTVVVRARGPSLIPFGITNALANPQLQLVRSSDQSVVATNDDWGSAANAGDITASGFAPSNNLESAILITLQPGAYTAIVSGVGGGTGVGIVEVFRN